jgi:hypothetical protein
MASIVVAAVVVTSRVELICTFSTPNTEYQSQSMIVVVVVVVVIINIKI